MFRKFGRLIVPLRIPLLVFWIALALLLGFTAPSISDVGSSDQTSFLPDSAKSIAARTLEAEEFAASGSASFGLLVLTREGGLTAADRGFAESIHNWLLSPQGPAIVQDVVSIYSRPEQESTLVSADGAAMLLQVNFTVEAFQPVVDEATYAIRERVQQGRPDGLAVHFTGEAGLGTDLVDSIVESTERTTIVTIILVIGLLFFIYRAPLAILIPLITISLAFLVSRGILGYLAQFGWQVSSLLDSYMVVLVFGAGTDYSLFFISRFREELAKHSAYEAAVRSVQRIGTVIAASAITTMVGLSALGKARFGLVQTMGPGLALSVGITLLAGLTLTPALLSIFGRYLFWPRKTSVENTQPSTFWVRVSNLVARRPLASVILITVLLAIPYLGLLQYRESLALIASLPKTTDSRQGFDAIANHFPRGEFAPAVVLLQLPSSADVTSTPFLRAVATLQDELLAIDGVDQTRSYIDPVGDGSASAAFTVTGQLDQIAASLRVPQADASGDPARRLNEASALVDDLQRYVDELAVAFPDVAQAAQFSQTREALARLSTTTTALRAQAHPATQLRQLAAQLRQPPPTQSPADPSASFAPVTRYLAELSQAFPDVSAQPAYGEATELLVGIQQLAQDAPAPANLSAQQRATLQSQLQDSAEGVAAQLNLLAGFFAEKPEAVFLPSDAAQELGENPTVEATTGVAEALSALRSVFAANPYPYFIPASLPAVEQAANAVMPLFISEDSKTVRLFVILNEDPQSADAIATLERVRQTVEQNNDGPLASAQVFLSGATAEVADVQRVIHQDLQAVGVVTVVGIFAVLAILLRSLVAPLYLVGTVVFSYGSSLGLSTLFFQGLLGHEGVYYLLPLTVMVMLIALGADYNVFLVHRIREESATLPLRDGVRVASARTGAIITAAGVILAGTFAALTASPLQMLFQMGAAVALGILIDALVVRSLLVPGIVTLIGSANWWPASIRANWWPLLPAGSKIPLGSEQGLARVVVYSAVAVIIAVTFATRGLWYPDSTVATAQAATQTDEVQSTVPTATPQLLVVPPTPATEATPTPAPTPSPQLTTTPSPSPTALLPPAPREYVVQTGDTLTAIALEFGVTVSALAEFNGIENPNAISAGQRLLVPPTEP